MKPWVEWLLSIALLLLVVSVIVALVVGFVRWFRPKPTTAEADSAGLEFDLGTPDQSTLLRRRQVRRQPERRYTGTSTDGRFYKIIVHPKSRTIDVETQTTSTTVSFTPRQSWRWSYDLLPPASSTSSYSSAVEMPGHGLVLAGREASQSFLVIALPENCTEATLPAGNFAYAKFSADGRAEFGAATAHVSPGTTAHAPLVAAAATGSKEPSRDACATASFTIDSHTLLNSGALVAGRMLELPRLSLSTQKDHFVCEKDDQVTGRMFFTPYDFVALSRPSESESVLLFPQMPSADLPFPTKAQFVGVATITDSSGEAASTSQHVRIHATSLDGQVTVTNTNQDVVLSAKLVPAAALSALDPCFGTFVANEDGRHVVAQIADEWCILRAHLKSSIVTAFALLTRK